MQFEPDAQPLDRLPRLIFVAGGPRSGTTLLQGLLCSSPDTNPLIGEATDLALLVNAYCRSRELFQGEQRDYFDDLTDLQRFYASIVTAWLAKTAQRFGQPATLVLKSPAFTPVLPDLLELLPQAIAIVAVRDVRDTVASLLKIGHKLKTSSDPRQTHQTHQTRQLNPHAQTNTNRLAITIEAEPGAAPEAAPGVETRTATEQRDPVQQCLMRQNPAELAQFYCGYYRACLDAQSPRTIACWSRLRFVRYEGLVQRPAAAIAQLREFTGLTLPEGSITQPWQRSAIDFAALPERYQAWWSGYDRALTADGVGRWRSSLSQEQVRAIKTVSRDWLRRFGYSEEF